VGKAAHYSQLAVKNYAKTLIALFEVSIWSHDPLTQLLRLLNRFPENLRRSVEELATIAKELVAEHGRTIYGEKEARDALNKALRARSIIDEILKALGVELQ